MRKASTKDCRVTGCTRAASSLAICRYHHSLLPRDFKMQMVNETWAAYERNSKRAARLAAQIERAAA